MSFETYTLTPRPSRAQIARQSARAACRRDGGQQFRVTAINPAGKPIEQTEPSQHDVDRLVFDLEHNRYTDIQVTPMVTT